jgi:hypothetical protein
MGITVKGKALPTEEVRITKEDVSRAIKTSGALKGYLKASIRGNKSTTRKRKQPQDEA